MEPSLSSTTVSALTVAPSFWHKRSTLMYCRGGKSTRILVSSVVAGPKSSPKPTIFTVRGARTSRSPWSASRRPRLSSPIQFLPKHSAAERTLGEDLGRTTLQNGGAHPGDLKPYFFLLERVNKSCERRKFSCRRQRSSGLAARVRANNCLSSSLSPGSPRIFRKTRLIFFPCSKSA